MSDQTPFQEARKPIHLDLQHCYSGFNNDELEYIDYSRTNAELDVQFLDSFCGKTEDGSIYERDYEESILSTDEFKSYLCSTPTGGRKHRGHFSQEDLSGFAGLEFGRNYSSNIDSGVNTRNASENSIVSIFGGDGSVAGCIEDLVRTSSPVPARRKIEIDSDIHDPYSNIDEFELSIEEISQMSTTTLGTLRRRLSLKYFRRTTSTGLFGSYLQRTPENSSSQTHLISTDQAPLLGKQAGPGPMNLWFRKFRNRHFI